MTSIYSFLQNVFHDIKQENKDHKLFFLTVLILWTIPLSYAINSISLGLFVLFTLITFRKENFRINKDLLPLILLYILMVLSFAWSINPYRTASALGKEIPLLLIPLCFFIFRPFSSEQKQKILKYYSFGMIVYSLFYIIRATFRYFLTKDTSVFFYHELVTKDLNAIHVSIYMALACFYFLTKTNKNLLEKIVMVFLGIFIFLLASKNVIVIFIILLACYFLFYSSVSKKLRFGSIIAIIILLISFSFVKQIGERFQVEINTNLKENTEAISKENLSGKVYNVSINQAWNKDRFQPSDFFPGTAFRVYQARIFKELLQEEPIFFKGYGLNASGVKINQKRIEHNLHPGYGTYNFHNQYIQNFAELGVFGFLILILALFINIKNAFKTKYFMHIAFAILMITLFLTESFLWRQRGVIYFTLFYCLFNTRSLIKAKKDTL